MRVNVLVAAFVVCATAVPVAEPVAEPVAATPVGYGPQTVTVTVNAEPTARTTTSTKKTSTKSSTVTVGPVATSRKITTTSTKKSTTSTKKSTTSTKKSTTSTKKSTTSTKSATVGTPLTTKKTTSTTTSKKTTSSTSKKTTSTAKATTTTSASGTTPTTLSEIVVYHHNLHRSNHSAVNIKWSASLASIAAEIAATCVYQHNTTAGGGGYGQNIAAGVQSNNISSVITDLFYNGEMPYYNGLYGEAQPSYANFAHWGHFSQLVWKDTTTVGCAVQHCTNGLANAGGDIAPYFTVCNYEPAGNYGGEYADNIGSPLGHPVAHWNTGL